MSDAKSNAWENGVLALVFNATTYATLAGPATSPATSIIVALHTADPTDSGNQSSSECAYTSYERVTTERTSTGWTVSGSTARPTSTISFPQATGGTETVTYFSVSLSTNSTADLLYAGTVTPNISVSNGVTPQLTTATVITES